MSMAGALSKMVNTGGEADLGLGEGEIKSSVLRIFASIFMRYIGYNSVVFSLFFLYGFDIRVILDSKN